MFTLKSKLKYPHSRPTNVMYLITFSILFLNILSLISCDNETETNNEVISINDVANTLFNILGINEEGKETIKIKELKEKLSKINSYVIDKDKYDKLLINATKITNLNETNFYKSLNDSDHLQFLLGDSKNLYLKLKEKMNRDDIMKILKERSSGKMMKYSRRRNFQNQMEMLDHTIPYKREKELDEIIDKLIGESPSDNHKFDQAYRYNKYWDPQTELEERNMYHKHDGRRIFKGERTTIRYYPFMVSVHVMGRFWCGGVIYWHDLIITSAACLQLMHNNRFFRENPKVLQVRIGSNHSRLGGELVDALEVYFHPAYNPSTLRNNIAVIRLRRHIKFNYHRVPKIIDISHNGDGMPFTAEVLLLGWGVKKMSQKLAYEPIFLQRKFLPVYPNVFCKEAYGEKFVTQTMFCAGTFSTGEGACNHDAGGPAILAGKLVGIISFGPTVCGYPNTPTVLTLVGAYADWIETINETMPAYYRGRKRTTTTTEISERIYFADKTTRMNIVPIRSSTEDLYRPSSRVSVVPTTTEGTSETETAPTEAAPIPGFLRKGLDYDDGSGSDLK